MDSHPKADSGAEAGYTGGESGPGGLASTLGRLVFRGLIGAICLVILVGFLGVLAPMLTAVDTLRDTDPRTRTLRHLERIRDLPPRILEDYRLDGKIDEDLDALPQRLRKRVRHAIKRGERFSIEKGSASRGFNYLLMFGLGAVVLAVGVGLLFLAMLMRYILRAGAPRAAGPPA